MHTHTSAVHTHIIKNNGIRFFFDGIWEFIEVTSRDIVNVL